MEAETFLTTGYGIRLAIEARAKGWVKLGKVAHVWQPSRLKGIQVSPEYGTPFLAATQAFDVRPIPRKWLSLERTYDATTRFVDRRTILVTCSGLVGRSTIAFTPHINVLISHDLLRVEARDHQDWGWLYAYLRAPKVRAMMSGARYGHIIKHLEVSHLNDLPILTVPSAVSNKFSAQAAKILSLREKAHSAMMEAEGLFERVVGSVKVGDFGEKGFSIDAGDTFFSKRRRMDALPYNPSVQAIYQHLQQKGKSFIRVRNAGFQVWLPSRFRRIPAQEGVELVSSSELFEINPDIDKRIADGAFGDPYRGRVEAGWMLLARSGQIYGLNGSVVLSTKALTDKVISDHVIRVAPTKQAKMRTGYLVTALSHPTLGRPLMKSLPYGSSIPEIDPQDFLDLSVVRIADRDENHIADLAEESADLRGQADVLEKQLASEAEALLDRFISQGNTR